jgi:hypothetical protein
MEMLIKFPMRSLFIIELLNQVPKYSINMSNPIFKSGSKRYPKLTFQSLAPGGVDESGSYGQEHGDYRLGLDGAPITPPSFMNTTIYHTPSSLEETVNLPSPTSGTSPSNIILGGVGPLYRSQSFGRSSGECSDKGTSEASIVEQWITESQRASEEGTSDVNLEGSEGLTPSREARAGVEGSEPVELGRPKDARVFEELGAIPVVEMREDPPTIPSAGRCEVAPVSALYIQSLVDKYNNTSARDVQMEKGDHHD